MTVAEVEKLLDLPNASMQIPFDLPLVITPDEAHFICENGNVNISHHFAAKVQSDRHFEKSYRDAY